MAEHQDEVVTAFQDDFTQRHGATFMILVEPIFADQVSEAASLLARSKADAERQDFLQQFVTAAQAIESALAELNVDGAEPSEEKLEEVREAQRTLVSDLLAAAEGSRLEATDRELEGFSNLILSFVLNLFSVSNPAFSANILRLVSLVLTGADRPTLPSLSARYTALATLFNALPTSQSPDSSTESLRLNLLVQMIEFALANDDFAIVASPLASIHSWLIEWGFAVGCAQEQYGNEAVASIAKALIAKSHSEPARQLVVTHISQSASGTSNSPDSLAALVTVLAVSTLAQPDVYDFGQLAALPSYASSAAGQLGELAAIMGRGDVAALDAFVAANGGLLSEHSLEASALTYKLRLVALAELCSRRVGDSVPYAEVADVLKLPAEAAEKDEGEEVENWLIDAIRAGLVSGKLSQTTRSFRITQAAPREFTHEHWLQLQSGLQRWRSSIDDILESCRLPNAVDLTGALRADEPVTA